MFEQLDDLHAVDYVPYTVRNIRTHDDPVERYGLHR